jgi:hypothetical protein
MVGTPPLSRAEPTMEAVRRLLESKKVALPSMADSYIFIRMNKYTQGRPFFPLAIGYRRSADFLEESLDKQQAEIPDLFPIYFLYSHAAELFLKAFLRLNGLSISVLAKNPYGHNLRNLYRKCKQCSLDLQELEPLLPLLIQGHDEYQFRYFDTSSVSTADLSWVREGVAKLADVVEAAVKKEADERDAKEAGMVLVSVIDKILVQVKR